jgi:hypothetical protein
VNFTDENANLGQATVEIDRIDKVAPNALAVAYTPSTTTT